MPGDDDQNRPPFNINELLQLLCQIVIERQAILGFYRTDDNQRVIVDIEQGHQQNIELFFNVRCPRFWQDQRIILVEQEYHAEALCHTDAILECMCTA